MPLQVILITHVENESIVYTCDKRCDVEVYSANFTQTGNRLCKINLHNRRTNETTVRVGLMFTNMASFSCKAHCTDWQYKRIKAGHE